MNQIPEGFAAMAGCLGNIDTEAFLEAMSHSPSTAIRINPAKLDRAAAASLYPDMEPVAWNDEGFYLAERPNFTLNPLLHAGAFYVQDASSMVYGPLFSQALEHLPEERRNAPRVLDLCAAPGGKTTAMLARMPRGGVMVANEYVSQRCAILRENMAKWGDPSVVVTCSDSAVFAASGRIFDVVAVDAPCSGEGMMRKDAEARSQWSPGLVEQCASLQRDILRNAVATLRPGGMLIYSTCTFNRTEDELNLAFLVEELGLEQVDTGLVGTGGILPGIDTPYPALRFMPHSTRGEGLFAALLRKPESDADDAILFAPRVKERKVKGAKGSKASLGNETLPDISSWLSPSQRWTLIPSENIVEAVTPATADILSLLGSGVRITARGVTAAERKGRDWAPASQLALCRDFNPDSFPVVELDENTALSYLRREAIAVPDAPKGFVTVTFRGIPLGLVKNLGQRANNLYPQKWKIRMNIP